MQIIMNSLGYQFNKIDQFNIDTLSSNLDMAAKSFRVDCPSVAIYFQITYLPTYGLGHDYKVDDECKWSKTIQDPSSKHVGLHQCFYAYCVQLRTTESFRQRASVEAWRRIYQTASACLVDTVLNGTSVHIGSICTVLSTSMTSYKQKLIILVNENKTQLYQHISTQTPVNEAKR